MDYIYIYLLSLATPARSASSLSIRVLGPQAAFTPSIGIASEGAFGLYAGGSSHIQPAKLCMDGQGTKPSILIAEAKGRVIP